MQDMDGSIKRNSPRSGCHHGVVEVAVTLMTWMVVTTMGKTVAAKTEMPHQ